MEEGCPLHRRIDVGVGLVVAPEGRPEIAPASQVTAAVTQVVGRGQGGVEDVLWVPHPVGVTVAAGDPEVALHDVPLAILQQLAGEIDGSANAEAGRSRQARRGPARAPRTFDVLQRWGPAPQPLAQVYGGAVWRQ